MRAAVLTAHGAPPAAGTFDEPVAEADDHAVVEVAAAGLNHLDLAKATGRFYTGPPPLPSVVGSDGVGRLPDGRRVYFDTVVAPHGAMAERALVATDGLLDVDPACDDASAAALGNAGLAAWLGLTHRGGLQAGETVLVLGATGAVGRIATQAAKLLGAGRVVALARPGDRLDEARDLGADATVALEPGADPAAALRAATAGGHHVAVDLLWGEPALASFKAAALGARHVQLGQMAGAEIALPAPLLRSGGLDVRGFAIFQAPVDVRRAAYAALTRHAAAGELRVDLEQVPLDAIGDAWARQAAGPERKLVVTP
jgi:NADPH2:quinone reductase